MMLTPDPASAAIDREIWHGVQRRMHEIRCATRRTVVQSASAYTAPLRTFVVAGHAGHVGHTGHSVYSVPSVPSVHSGPSVPSVPSVHSVHSGSTGPLSNQLPVRHPDPKCSAPLTTAVVPTTVVVPTTTVVPTTPNTAAPSALKVSTAQQPTTASSSSASENEDSFGADNGGEGTSRKRKATSSGPVFEDERHLRRRTSSKNYRERRRTYVASLQQQLDAALQELETLRSLQPRLPTDTMSDVTADATADRDATDVVEADATPGARDVDKTTGDSTDVHWRVVHLAYVDVAEDDRPRLVVATEDFVHALRAMCKQGRATVTNLGFDTERGWCRRGFTLRNCDAPVNAYIKGWYRTTLRGPVYIVYFNNDEQVMDAIS